VATTFLSKIVRISGLFGDIEEVNAVRDVREAEGDDDWPENKGRRGRRHAAVDGRGCALSQPKLNACYCCYDFCFVLLMWVEQTM
jgi:hypothetical protein